jgi:acetyltransferase-like isoleucine patch superfamily enzyme
MDIKETSTSDVEFLGFSGSPVKKDPLAWFPRAAGKLRTLWLRHTYPFASFGKKAWAHYSCRLARSAAPYISIGKNVGLARDSRIDVSAVKGNDPPVVILEENCGLGRWCVISARNHIHVMRDVLFGPSVLVMDHGAETEQEVDPNGQRSKRKVGKIRIEPDCWIGFGTVIVCDEGELIIGRRSIVGANSVIRQSIPPYSVVAGDPARIVKQYDFSKSAWVLGCIRPIIKVNRQNAQPAAE